MLVVNGGVGFVVTGGSDVLTFVPEPGSLTRLASGLIGAGAVRRRVRPGIHDFPRLRRDIVCSARITSFQVAHNTNVARVYPVVPACYRSKYCHRPMQIMKCLAHSHDLQLHRLKDPET